MKRGRPLARRTPLRARKGLAPGKPLAPSQKALRRTGLPGRKRKPPKDPLETYHLDRVAGLGCLVCGKPATVHHVTSDGFKRIARSDRLVVPLCPIHHQAGHDPKASDPVSVERLGHAGFRAKYGIDLLATAEGLWIITRRGA